jgi:hypothetical protein
MKQFCTISKIIRKSALKGFISRYNCALLAKLHHILSMNFALMGDRSVLFAQVNPSAKLVYAGAFLKFAKIRNCFGCLLN